MTVMLDVPEGKVEVMAKAQRRRFSAEYKRRILRAVEGCTQSA
jgi:hypothetical protein